MADEVAELCERLRQLWEESGKPPLAAVGKRTGVSKSRISELHLGQTVSAPPWNVVQALVETYADHGARAGAVSALTTDLRYWRALHGRAERSPRPTPARRPAAADWTDLVRSHPAWTGVDEASGHVAMAMTAAEQLFAASRAPDDPWRDDALPKRVTAQVGALIGLIGEVGFSPLEAALLALAPLAHHARTVRVDVDEASFARFLDGQQERRLVARGLPEIDKWLRHRWLATQPLPPTSLDLPEPTRRVVVDALDRVTRLFRLSPGDLGNPDRLDLRPRTSHLGGVVVRERLIGLLLAAAHALAVEPIALSPVVVEHLGVPNPVDLARLRSTLAELSWEPVHIGLGLVAECHHEAVMEALRDQVTRVDAVLSAIHAVSADDAHLQPLLLLPARASADRVVPASVDGIPAFTVPVTRFRLDETRVRELLMGEQLYGDRSLAVRELYQNALDACRYRQARHQFLDRTDWSGRITFEQGVDDTGRHYLRCTDNGIGMGAQELREVFSQAGIRFADRPEFAEEQAEWAERDIHLHPNSRFGIGVLSYFMLADEIEVTTCRMDRHGGRPGPVWRVWIVGPGHLFRISQVEDHGTQPGTTVTLYLRDLKSTFSCVEVLDRLLGIAEFHTTAEDDGVAAEWEPFVFRPRNTSGVNGSGELVHGPQEPNGQVVWCENGGALLADGLYTTPAKQLGVLKTLTNHPDLRGAVVNLTRDWVPRLTVDRTTVLDDVSDQVERLLDDAAPTLLVAAPEFLSERWLHHVADTSPGVADIVASAAIETNATSLGEDFARIGCSPGGINNDRSRTNSGAWLHPMPDWILFWHLLAHVPALLGAGGPVRAGSIMPALPSDWTVLARLNRTTRSPDVAARADPVDAADIADVAALLGRGPRAVARRLAELGYPVENPDSLPERAEPGDRALLAALSAGRSIPQGHVAWYSRAANLSPAEVAERLRAYSFDVAEFPVPRRYTEADVVLLSRDLDGRPGWLVGAEVGTRHAESAAEHLRWPLGAVVDRLAVLGYRVTGSADENPAARSWFPSRKPQGRPWLDDPGTDPLIGELDLPDETWSPARALHAAIFVSHRTQRSLSAVLDWIEQQGSCRPRVVPDIDVATRADSAIFHWQRSCQIFLQQHRAPGYLQPLVTRNAHLGPWDGTAARLAELGIAFRPFEDQDGPSLLVRFDERETHSPDEPVSIRQVLGLALTTGLPVAEVVARLEELDFEVEPVEEAIERLMGRVPRVGG
ncbi:HD domain-containing protein [Actinokineospora terrae]|uniref:Histidine kinase-, DNA gyrase B-, and HSP90-like ATPase n=1 Tax=Actinokineospora terrae TaxID=155974 RepID=A0A1H9NU33_9PSEU|nr:hypothetical protein [Actinokineospora terrae]SER38843.1 hypothetical protein SAMN04487818_103108 [Actinokineospora terrae]